MKFEATCPHCGKRYRVDDEFLGRRGACKGCGSSFVFRPDTDGSLPEEYLEWFRAVKAELVARFGPADDLVHFSPVPLYVDPQHGLAESLQFRNYVPGLTYCTCPLSLYESDQQPNRDGYYELMMCGRRELPFAPNFIGGLATYTFERALNSGDTIDLGPDQPPGSNMRGLLACTPEIDEPIFELYGKPRTILLLVGITLAEMEACLEYGSEGVLLKLKAKGVFPYTTLERRSVI